MLLKLIGVWAIADAAWMAVDRERWARFWGRWLEKIGDDDSLARGCAAAEFLVGLLLVVRRR